MSDTAHHPTRLEGETMIRLDELSKRYPGQDQPAVTNLSMDIGRGEIVVFVGPSGCGKTTTMKLINRIIEPTSGRIFLEGDDVMAVNPDRLRRRIGYAIQQVGLFPHMTVGDNIATVPRMLGWDRRRVARRVDELLDLIGLDSTFRDRYPKQLSGGQQQRVGVARALGADPPVMLMDEPFGAIDPLTRDALQNEFLHVQQDIKKTIVFVTHDIDEAIKMGDRIAILKERAVVAQYDTPERILSDPADEFVQSFVGSGAAVKSCTLTSVGDVDVQPWPTMRTGTDPDTVLAELRRTDHDFLLLLDEDSRPTGWVPADVSAEDTRVLSRGVPVLSPMRPEHTLYNALNAMLGANSQVLVVVDGQGRYRGVLSLDGLSTLTKHGQGDHGRAVAGSGAAAYPKPEAP